MRHTLQDHIHLFRPEEDRARLPLDMSAEETLQHLGNEHDRAYVATLPQLPWEMLEELLRDPSAMVRSACLCNPNVSLEAIEGALMDESAMVRAAAASSWNAPADILDEVARNDEPEVVQAVALNPNTHPETLVWLLEQEEFVEYVAENTSLPEDLLPKLWNDSTMARAGVASNPNCPVYLLIAGLSDPSPEVRRSCARNLGVPEPSLEQAVRTSLRNLAALTNMRLAAESREAVVETEARAKAVRKRMEELMAEQEAAGPGGALIVAKPPQLTPAAEPVKQKPPEEAMKPTVVTHDPWLQVEAERALIMGAMTNKKCSEEALLQVLDLPEKEMKRMAAMSPAATPEVLKKALKQPEESVRTAAVNNNNADVEVLNIALRSDPEHMERQVAKNPRATAEMLEEIYERNLELEREHFMEERVLSLEERRHGAFQSVQVRGMVLEHPNAGVRTLNKAMKDPRRNLRIRAVNHRHSTLKMLQKALKDKQAVQTAAKAQIEKRGLVITPDQKVVKPIVMEPEHEVKHKLHANTASLPTGLTMGDDEEDEHAHLYAGPTETTQPTVETPKIGM